MRHIFACILLLSSVSIVAQQDPSAAPSVEKSIFGIQTGLLGVWVHNEARLSDQFALRSEIGFDTGFYGGMLYDETKYAMIPVINIEPRWYYNLARRVDKGKNISKNSGNFLTVKTLFAPDWFVISNDDSIRPLNQLAFVPKYGLRRVYGKHFTFEAGLGIGVVTYFGKNDRYYLNSDGEAFIDLHLRIGYSF